MQTFVMILMFRQFSFDVCSITRFFKCWSECNCSCKSLLLGVSRTHLNYSVYSHAVSSESCKNILTGAWTLESYVKKQSDVGLSISLLATQPRVFEINKICLSFELRLRKLCLFHLKPASLLTCFDARKKLLYPSENPRSC